MSNISGHSYNELPEDAGVFDAWTILKYLIKSAPCILCKGTDPDSSGFHSCNLCSPSPHSSSS